MIFKRLLPRFTHSGGDMGKDLNGNELGKVSDVEISVWHSLRKRCLLLMLSEVLLYFRQKARLTAKNTIRIMRAIVISKEDCYEINLDDHCDDHKLCVGICVYRRFTGIDIRCRKCLHAYRRGGYRLSLMGQIKEITLTLNYYR